MSPSAVQKEFLLEVSSCIPSAACCLSPQQAWEERSLAEPHCAGLPSAPELGTLLQSAGWEWGGWVRARGSAGEIWGCIRDMATRKRIWRRAGQKGSKDLDKVPWCLVTSATHALVLPCVTVREKGLLRSPAQGLSHALFFFPLAWMWMSFLLQVTESQSKELEAFCDANNFCRL